MSTRYSSIVTHYEACLDQFGDTHRGVDWPNAADAETRYRTMLEVLGDDSSKSVSLLDFGCGTAHLLEYMRRHSQYDNVVYSGLDISGKFIATASAKFPEVTFHQLDVLQHPEQLPEFDYVVLNGVLTERCDLSHQEMMTYAEELLSVVFTKARTGIAFNVMSKLVDWERDDLFHLSLDAMSDMIARRLSRHFVVRHDYRLFEYTVYVYR